MAFNQAGKAPGVYIDEVQVPGAIVGVGTSTAAFVGPARNGPLGEPTFLTSWNQFVEKFGRNDKAGPYFPGHTVYLPYAVRGFFDNGGSSCYVVRIATSARASLTLKDANGVDTLVVTAKAEGVAGNTITAAVRASSIRSADVLKAAATLTAASGVASVTVNNVGKLTVGDMVVISGGGATATAEIDRIDPTTNQLTMTGDLGASFATGATVRIADIAAGAKRLHFDDASGVEPGTVLRLTQGPNTEDVVVASADARTGVVGLEQPTTNALTMTAAAPRATAATVEFVLDVGGTAFANLSMDPRHSRYVRSAVRSDAVDVTLSDPPSTSAPPGNQPAVLAATQLANGRDDGPPHGLTAADYKSGIDTLRRIDDVNVLCVPDWPHADIGLYMIEHCTAMQDRFAVLDPVAGESIDEIRRRRLGDAIAGTAGLTSERGFGALYYPCIAVADPLGGKDLVTVPPSGHVAGLYARVDGERGVFKAPANAVLAGARGLERSLTEAEQGPLNSIGVNVIRSFPGRGIRVWGARTLAAPDETQWRYVNVRRLLLFLEESIQEATQFAVFEPNNLVLWGRLKRQVSEFLTRAWADGALFGATADDAFSVRIDEDLNPPALRQLGQLLIEVKLYPTTPAEFVVFRIVQQPGGPVVEET